MNTLVCKFCLSNFWTDVLLETNMDSSLVERKILSSILRNAARCIGPAHLSTRDTCAGRSASGSGSCQKRITLF